MAHGISLKMRAVKPAPATFIHQHPVAVKRRFTENGPLLFVKPAGMTTFVNPDRDRSLRGKARRDARKTARR